MSKNLKNRINDAAHKSARAASEPAPVRRYRSLMFQIALVLVASAFGVLTFLVKSVPYFAIDLQLTKTIQMINFPFFTLLMSMVSWLGFFPQSIIITGLIFLLIYRFGLHWEAVMALVAAVIPTAINVLVKSLIQRPRPLPNLVNVIELLPSYSFPSGHVMFYLSYFGFLGFLSFSLLKSSIKRTFLLILFGGLITMVGVSRIYLGQHWASDVVGAYLLGSLTLAAIIQFYLLGKTRFFVNQPVAAAKPPKRKRTGNHTS
jgi:membrane-associated phospholipid phosphatase